MTASFRFSKTRGFGIFSELLSFQIVNLARFARNVEWDFFCDFQAVCASKKYSQEFLFLYHKNTIVSCRILISSFQSTSIIPHNNKKWYAYQEKKKVPTSPTWSAYFFCHHLHFCSLNFSTKLLLPRASYHATMRSKAATKMV